MPDHDGDAHPGKLLCDRSGLLGVAGVVAHFERELSSQHAAGGVDVRERLFGAVSHLPAECCLAARHWAGSGNGDVGSPRRAGSQS